MELLEARQSLVADSLVKPVTTSRTARLLQWHLLLP